MTHPTLPEGLIDAMKEAALAAGENAVRHKKQGFNSETKPDRSYVTKGDTEGEAIIKQQLHNYGFGFLGEESGETQTESDFQFVVDPIDGTTNYVRGVADWMVSIGLTYRGKPIAGVTYQPLLKKLYWAESGKGAFLDYDGEVTKLDQRGKKPIAYVFDILTNRPLYMETAALHQMLSEDIKKHTKGTDFPRYRTLGCPSVPLCQLAEGSLTGVISWPINLYDVAASMVVAEEAGMKIRLRKSADGKEQIVATIPELFESTCYAFDVTLGKHAHYYDGRAENGVVDQIERDGMLYGVSVGRRQPMHQAHLDCIQEIVDAGLKPIIVIGSANSGKNKLFNPLENPLNEAQQREQITKAMQKAEITDYEILALPDMGNMDEWAASLRHLLKANGVEPTKAACHYRAKEDTAKDNAELIKPMNASDEALMRYGMSVWKSYNVEQKMDGISATIFRSMNLQDPQNKQVIDTTLVAPDYIREQALAAREANPDKALLAELPISMLDLTLMRLQQEREISTATLLNNQPADSIKSLTKAVIEAMQKPSTHITGELGQAPAGGQQRS